MAQDDQTTANGEPTKATDKTPTVTDQIVETRHSVHIGGQEVHYTVTTGTIILREEAEKKGDDGLRLLCTRRHAAGSSGPGRGSSLGD